MYSMQRFKNLPRRSLEYSGRLDLDDQKVGIEEAVWCALSEHHKNLEI